MKFNKLLSKILVTILAIGLSLSAFPVEIVKAAETNPFAAADQQYLQKLDMSTKKIEAKAFSTMKPAAVSEKEATFIVGFKDSVSMQNIADMLKGITYDLLGMSTQKVFSLYTDMTEKELQIKFGNNVKYISKNEKIGIIDDSNDTISSKSEGTVNALANPDDPYYTNQWYMSALNIAQAWTIKNDASSVMVAVIDSGVDGSHEDLIDAYVAYGWDYVTNDYCYGDPYGHGTNVTGIIAATANNGIGIAGIAQGVKIIPLRVLDSSGSGDVADTVSAIYKAADIGCKVINLSLGGTSKLQAEQDAINYAVDKGCIVIAASGNYAEKGNPLLYPACFDNVISVGAVTSELNPSSFSTYNNKVDVAAPGSYVLTTDSYYSTTSDPYQEGIYIYQYGTSFAAPCVSAIAALAVAKEPTITPSTFEQRLKNGAKDIYSAGYDTKTGYGFVNAYKTLGGTSIAAPIVTVTVGDCQATLSWKAVSGAKSYVIYKYNSSTKTYAAVKSGLTSTSYKITGLTNGTKYIYAVRAYDGKSYSSYANVAFNPIVAPKPIATSSNGSVTLKWSKVTGAISYTIYSYNASTKKYTTIKSGLTTTSYAINNLTNGNTYTYLVRAYNGTSYSAYTTANHVSITLAKVYTPNVTATAGTGSIKLTWAKITGATSYTVYSYNSSTKKYTPIVSLSGTDITFLNLTKGKSYTYLVRAFSGTAGSTFTTANHVTTVPK